MIARILNSLIDWLRQERIKAHCKAMKDCMKTGQKDLAREHLQAVRLEQALMTAERRQRMHREQADHLDRARKDL